LAHVAVRLDRVPQLERAPHLVAVATPDSLDDKEALRSELGNDPLCCPLGDANPQRQVTGAKVRLFRQAKQSMGVIREEGPVVTHHGGFALSHKVLYTK